MLSPLAAFLHRNRFRVLAAAVVGFALALAFGVGVAKHMSPYGASDPATQSVQATNRFQASAGRQIDPGIVALISTTNPQRVKQVAALLAAQPSVAEVTRGAVSRDGTKSYVVAYFKPLSDKRLKNTAQQIENRFAGQHDVILGGGAIANAQVNTQVSHDLAHAELLAFPFIFLLSLLFFRSLVASVLPPLLGGLAIVSTFLALRVVVGFVDLSVFALNLVTGLGLGLAIDYSLFMVSRYREEAAVHGFGAEALRRTLTTAGRTILFSSLTIAGAIASLAVFPQRFLYSMGIAGAIGALISAVLALVVLPALLAALGPRVNALAPRRLARAADREARPAQSGAWYRLSQFVMRRPARVAIASAAVLIALGIPFAGIKFISVDASVLPPSLSARHVQNVLNAEFPPGRTSPVEVVVGAPAGSPQVRALASRIRALPTVSAVAPAVPAGPATSLLPVAAPRSQPAPRPPDPRAARAVLRRRGRRDGELHRPRAQPLGPSPARARHRGRSHADRAVSDDRLGRAPGEGCADERAQPERDVRDPRGDLPGRKPAGAARIPQPGRARRDPADLPVRRRLRPGHRLRRVPALADQGSARRRRFEPRGGGGRARADGADRHGSGALVLGGDRRLRHLADRLHQGARARRRARRAHRRLRDPRPARAVADGTAGVAELVGAAPATAPSRAGWAAGGGRGRYLTVHLMVICSGNPANHEKREHTRGLARPLERIPALEAGDPALARAAGVRDPSHRGLRAGQAARHGLRHPHRPRHDHRRAGAGRPARHVHLRGADGQLPRRAPGGPRALLRDHRRRPRMAPGAQR